MIATRLGVVALLATGCTFNPGDATAGIDAAPGPGSSDAPPAATPRCNSVPDPTGLRLCLDFEQDPSVVARDDSGQSHNAAASQVLPAQRDEPTVVENAVAMGLASSLTIAETPDLDITTELTAELWVLPTKIVGLRGWLVDSSEQYFLSIGDDGKLRCGVNRDRQLDSDGSVPVDGHWHHVACTVENDLLQVYIDGDLQGCRDREAIVNVAGTTTIGVKATNPTSTDHFVGALDNVHVFARTLTPAEICVAAGKLPDACNAVCP